MIEAELARKFIEQVTQYTEYNINIMDETGVIIASRNPERVGKYHEVADRIIHGQKDVIVISDDSTYPGVLPGINMAIILDGRKEAAEKQERAAAQSFDTGTIRGFFGDSGYREAA